MIIVVEGPDGSGKSTLVSQLARQTGYKVIHRVAPETQQDVDLMYLSYWEEMHRAQNLIYDRAWYSDMVYGPIYRGKATITYNDMYRFEERMAKVGGMIIHCTDNNLRLLWDRCQARGEDNPGNPSKFEEDYDKFVSVVMGFNRLMSIPHYIPVVNYGFKEV